MHNEQPITQCLKEQWFVLVHISASWLGGSADLTWAHWTWLQTAAWVWVCCLDQWAACGMLSQWMANVSGQTQLPQHISRPIYHPFANTSLAKRSHMAKPKLLGRECYGWDVCVPPKLLHWNLTPKAMAVGGGAFGRRLGLEGPSLMIGASALLKDGLERSLVPSHRVRIQGQWALCNSFYQNPEYRHPDLGLATSRTVRNRFLWFFNYPYLVFGYSSLNRPRQRCKVHQPRGESHGQTQPQWGGVVHSFQSRGVKGVNICRIISYYE